MITTNYEKLNDELLLVAKLFFTEQQLREIKINFNYQIDSDLKIINRVDFKGLYNTSYYEERLLQANNLKFIKRCAKLCLYNALVKLTKKRMPWGCLTGIRPTKLFYELIAEEGNEIKAKKRLITEFYVSKPKAKIVADIVREQNICIDDKKVNLYVNIPFCTSRCYYCSFVSMSLKQCEKFVKPYIDALKYELIEIKKFLQKKNYKIKTIYIGGGTPTSLQASCLDEILSLLKYQVEEFTVEAGRPDTITKEKLTVLKKHGVTRISINPQSFSNTTLAEIGRNHTAEDIFKAFEIAKPFNFDINMDIIAGLANEKLKDFKKTLKKVVKLNPENITVHTLSIKNTSYLKTNGGKTSNENQVVKMINYSVKYLYKHGYKPYYLYKQKNMLSNLENIGYCKTKVCTFNIDSMEETASIVAVGANAISKRYFSANNKIERQANVKNLEEYIKRANEMIEKKKKLFL